MASSRSSPPAEGTRGPRMTARSPRAAGAPSGVGLAVCRVAVARAPGESLEAAARAARFAALAGANADVVALAHHADDQAETLLLQLLRGAGPHGLAAMSERRGTDGPTL